MNVNFVFIDNYKSLVNRNNKLKVEPSLTTVIGKNESGKSNLIDILGYIDLMNGFTDQVYKMTPQSIIDAELSVKVESTFTDQELETLELDLVDKETKFIISKEYNPYKVAISGGLQKYFQKECFKKHLNIIEELINENIDKISTNVNTKKNIISQFNFLTESENYIIRNYKQHLDYIQKNIQMVLEKEDNRKIKDSINFIKTYFTSAYEFIPIFYKYTENNLLSHYSLTEKFFVEKGKGYKSLEKFLIAAECDIEDVKTACVTHYNAGPGMDAKRKIENGIQKNIVSGFNRFYKQEESVSIDISIGRNSFSIFVRTNEGSSINISERSEGLKWYLNLYIDILSNNLIDKNLLFLIDEPGIQLHVDAQKRVLELFEEFASEKNQVIYTTHSPFMINEDRIDQIRVMQKNKLGHSEIITSVLAGVIPGDSKSESLSPLINALGMKLYQNIGMTNIGVNIITEGHSDAIYLSTMAKKLKIDGMKFIPSKGASQIIHLVSILWGWGFPYKILLDSDEAGRIAEDSIKKVYGLVDEESLEEKIVMISDILDDSSVDREIENLISDEDIKKVNSNYTSDSLQSDNQQKMIFASTFSDYVDSGQIELSIDTIDNFKKLFKILSS